MNAEQEPSGDQKDEQRVTASKRLIGLASDSHLFHTPEGECYAGIPVQGHIEVWPLRAREFRTWLTGRFFRAEGRAPSTQAMNDAIGTLEAKARFEGPKEEVHLRVALRGGKVYIDLGNDSWQVAEVTEDGWKVLSASPIRFRRPASMLSLPQPIPTGSLEDLFTFVNLPKPEERKLLLAFLVMCLRGKGPFPLLVLQGEQGSAKSTTARVIRSLIDPSSAPLRTTPKDEHNLVIMAKQSWVLSFDNLSGVQPWLSDALCRMSTGSGFSTRALYSDSDEIIFSAQRPVVVNGIDDVASRDDLKDRSISLSLPPISPEERRDEDGFWKDFEATKGNIFGALLSALAGTLRALPDVDRPSYPRMADFSKTGTALEAALGWPAGSFSAAYEENRSQALAQSAEDDALASAILAMVLPGQSKTFTATDWLRALGEYVGDAVKRSSEWPKGPGAYSNRLRRLQPILRPFGVTVRKLKLGHDRTRMIAIEREDKASPSSAASA